MEDIKLEGFCGHCGRNVELGSECCGLSPIIKDETWYPEYVNNVYKGFHSRIRSGLMILSAGQLSVV